MEPLSLNELAELLLVASYAETETLGHMNFFISVTEVAANLGIEDQQQIIEACHLLEEKGCILLAFDHATALSASITPEGEDYITRGGETGIIGQYQRYCEAKAGGSGGLPGIEFEGPDTPAPYTAPQPQTTPDSAAHVAPAAPKREDLHHIVASLEMLINNDASLSPTQRFDLVLDLKSLEMQISRNAPRKPVIDAIASDLRRFPALAALVDLIIAKI